MCLVAALVLLTACAHVPEPGEAPTDLPEREPFIDGGVSAFLENRCATLDCHGQVGRPLRIYSSTGLRMNDGLDGGRDLSGTTPEERLANYFAVVGLEPEAISRCYASGGTYLDFMLVKKPLGIDGRGVRHKGGSVLRLDDDGFTCLVGWMSGRPDSEKCRAAQL
jgi:hypothetical protein